MTHKKMKIIPVLMLTALCVAVMMFAGKNMQRKKEAAQTEHLSGFKVFCPTLSHCGDSFLLYNDSDAVLIDTGEADDSDSLLAQLSETGIEDIDVLILTHYDKDHIGGAPAILNTYPVKKIYMACATEDSEAYEALEEALKKSDAEKIYLTYKETFSELGADFTLYPSLKAEYSEDTDNNISIITEVLYKSSSLLFMGDAESKRVTEFAHKQYSGISYDFLKVAHHGRDNSITQKLFEKYFTPKFAVITSSEDEPEDEDLVEYMINKGVDVALTKEGSITYYVNEYGIGKNEPLTKSATDETAADEGTAEETTEEAEASVSSSSVESPVFSEESGFYDDSFELTIDVPEGTTVYYTTDSSTPTTDSYKYDGAITISDPSSNENVYCMNENLCPYRKSPLYEGQEEVIPGYYRAYYTPDVTVDKCAVIRAVAVDKDGNQSPVTTASYFVGFQNKKGYSNMSVMSLVSDPDGLFSDDNGIMVTGSQYKEALNGPLANVTLNSTAKDYTNCFTWRGREAERDVHIDYFESEDQPLTFSQEAGIRLHGNMSRVNQKQKSFNLYARKSYDGNETFKTDFFGDGLLSDTVTLMFGRNLREYIFTGRLSDRKITSQNYRLVQVFLDGEYWGFYAIQDRYSSETYMEQHYNVTEDNYAIASGKASKWKVKNGDEDSFNAGLENLQYFVSHNDLSDEDTYDKLCSMMDVQSYIDVYASRLYVCDQDWNSRKNQYIFYSKGQWHWMIYDLDAGAMAQKNTDPTVDNFTGPRLVKRLSLATDPYFTYLMKNQNFCRQFVTTFMDLANYNFGSSYMSALLTEFQNTYSDELQLNVDRYMENDESAANNAALGTNSFTRRIEKVIYFFNTRFGYATEHLSSYFGLSGSLKNVTIHTDEPEGGTITLNTITPELNENNSFTGQYYTDYPVSVTAKEKEGYTFAGWKIEGGEITEGKETSETISVSFSDDVTITALFNKN